MCREFVSGTVPFSRESGTTLSRAISARSPVRERSSVVCPPKESVSAVWRSPEHQLPIVYPSPPPIPTSSATAHSSGCNFTRYTLEEAGVTLARGDNQVALARGGDLEKVGVDARGSDRRAGAGPACTTRMDTGPAQRHSCVSSLCAVTREGTCPTATPDAPAQEVRWRRRRPPRLLSI